MATIPASSRTSSAEPWSTSTSSVDDSSNKTESTETSSPVSSDRSTSPSIGTPVAEHKAKYFKVFDEAKANGITYALLNQPSDGYTLYRALARQIIGDPTEHRSIAEAVLNFAIRARSNLEHPMHDFYLAQEASFRSATRRELFSLLDCPDLLPRNEIYWVVAHALGIRIAVYASITPGGLPQDLIATAGASQCPRHALLKSACDHVIQSRFSALVPDDSGKQVIEYLLDVKHQLTADPGNDFYGLEIKKMVWAWRTTKDGQKVSRFNEHRSKSQPGDLDTGNLPAQRMDVLTTVVSHVSQIPAALEIFKKALELAPAQEIAVRVSKDYDKGTMKPHFSADVEFVKLPQEKIVGTDRQEQNALVDCGEVEELCSVVTIAIGSHYCVLFNVLYMMEHPDDQTVPALSQLFREIIFDPAMCKLWWKLQSDFTVMDSTIAHLFQGTPRQSFTRTSWQGTKHLINPTWKLKSTFFEGARPADLMFPTLQKECELHAAREGYEGMSCPCELGNIDIAALFNHFCRLQGLHIPVMHWTAHRHHFNYAEFLDCMLIQNRLWHVLSYMKDCLWNSPLCAEDGGVYQNLGRPDMQLDDCAMAYNIGDVIGQNVAFEQLMASDNVSLIADCLSRYHTKQSSATQRRPKQHFSSLGSVEDIPLFEDNPNLYATQTFINEAVSEQNVSPTILTTDDSLWGSNHLAPWDHDRRVDASRAIISSTQETPTQSRLYESPSWWEQQLIAASKKDLLTKLTDPRRLWLPASCTNIIQNEYEDPIVRANVTHSEALIELVMSRHVAENTAPPPGFCTPVGASDGLPGFLHRVPGSSLPLAADIYHAFVKRAGTIQNAPPAPPAPHSEKSIMIQGINVALTSGDATEVWMAANAEKHRIRLIIEGEKNQNLLHGPPSVIDHTDMFDPEGRKYRRMVEAAADWNRPALASVPETYADGSWKSRATVRLEELQALAPKEVTKDEGWKSFASKRWKFGW